MSHAPLLLSEQHGNCRHKLAIGLCGEQDDVITGRMVTGNP